VEVVGELGRGGDLAGSSGSTASAAWLSGIDVDSFSSAMAPPVTPPSRSFPRGPGGTKQVRGEASLGAGRAAGWGGSFWLAASSSKHQAKRLVTEYAREGTGRVPGGERETKTMATTGRRRQLNPGGWRGGVTNLPLDAHH